MAPVTVTGQCELTNRKVTTTEKKDIFFIKMESVKHDYGYFSDLIDMAMSGKTSLRAPSQKDIDMAQKSLDENEV